MPQAASLLALLVKEAIEGRAKRVARLGDLRVSWSDKIPAWGNHLVPRRTKFTCALKKIVQLRN
jgi:hypothetical protein